MNQKETNSEVEVDLLQLVQSLWKRAWLILLAALICACACFAYTKAFVTPLYRARTTMYVNNKTATDLSQNSVSASDLNASFHLVETYTVFLQSRSTLDEVAAQIGLPYTYDQLKKMVYAVGIEDTSAFEVIVTSKDPDEAAMIANTIGDVLPGKISDYIPGSSVKVVDEAIAPDRPYAPSAKKNAVLGALLGILVSCGVLVVKELMDSQIHSSEYLTQNYDIPVLAVIPDLMTAGNGNGYYRQAADAVKANEKGGKSHV